jgi:general secretion pathway protein B
MSFILDALKKSESDRQRQSGPALFEAKVATPRAGLPLWAVALAALLVVNIGVVVWLLLRKPAPEHPLVAVAPAATAPLAQEQSSPAAAAAPYPQAALAPPQIIEPKAPPVEDTGELQEDLNPEDYEPAVNPGSVKRGNDEGLPSYSQLASAAGTALPQLRLDMHVYSSKPQERFIFLNMQRLHEGNSLPNGVRVEQITPDGVILSHHGSKFVIERE